MHTTKSCKFSSESKRCSNKRQSTLTHSKCADRVHHSIKYTKTDAQLNINLNFYPLATRCSYNHSPNNEVQYWYDKVTGQQQTNIYAKPISFMTRKYNSCYITN